MSKIPAPKGFEDILPADSWKWHAIEAIARELGELYHFAEIRTPILEHSDLFHRGVGETTDIVHKETFTFKDRGGDSMTLRPEGTAGVVRAAIEHGLIAQEGSRVKVYYIAPNFRYERPQKGRLRQHHQFGAEAFGIADAAQDVECILLQMDFYRRCGIKDLSLQINSLGDAESKQRYRDALVKFLKPKEPALSEDSQRRLETNPLRILASKDPGAQEASRAKSPKPCRPILYSHCHGETARDAKWKLLHELRANNTPADMDLSNRSVKAQFKLSDREQATHCLILGDSELANETITLKDLKTGQQSTVPRSDLLRVLRDLRG